MSAPATNFRNHFSLLASLNACAKRKDLDTGRQLHALINRGSFLEHNIYLGNALVNMYAKCGALPTAQHVLDGLPVRDIVSWNALIAGYTQHGCGREALSCFDELQRDGLCPNAVTYSCFLKACGSIGALRRGKELHVEIARRGMLVKDMVLGNSLVDMYAKCGDLMNAQQVFDELPDTNVVSWTSLIAGYVQHGQHHGALDCLRHMQLKGFTPDAVTFACILKSCGSTGAIEKGEQLHDEIVRKGLLGTNNVLDAALIDMYAKCGALAKAQQVVDDLPDNHILSWTALITGYCQHGWYEEAFNCFDQMQFEGHSPDSVIFLCVLRACAMARASYRGSEIHALIMRKGLLQEDITLGNALLDMYVECDDLAQARQLFEELPARDLVSWTVLIAGYAQHGQGEEALKIYDQMKGNGLFPDRVTFLCILKACGSIGATDKGEVVHEEIVKSGLLGKENSLSSALVDMYAKCGALTKAQKLLDELLVRDAFSWTALITGYVQHACGEEALVCYERMQWEGLSPDMVTFLSILKACSNIGATKKGEELHVEIVKGGLLQEDVVLGNALVDMYAKCGALAKAQEVFYKLPVRTVISWNVLLAGYSQLGKHEIVFDLFTKMLDNIKPDLVSFTIVLSNCGQSGQVEKGEMFFEAVSKYGIIPTPEHITCMVDLFARAGHFDKAMAMIKRMPSSGHLPAWLSLLGACRKWGNTEFGRLVFEQVMELEEKLGLCE